MSLIQLLDTLGNKTTQAGTMTRTAMRTQMTTWAGTVTRTAMRAWTTTQAGMTMQEDENVSGDDAADDAGRDVNASGDDDSSYGNDNNGG
jgi:hypothetical protein